jgi:DNA primase
MDSENSIFDASNALITKEKFSDFFQKMKTLPKNHFAIQYLISRKIPQEKIETEFYYTDDFRQSTIDVLTAANQPTESYTSLRSHDARIIIPFIDENQIVLGFQGRTLNPNNKVRYITIKINPESPKIYGLHALNRTLNKVYVLEGPIDSMFIPNSVAVMDANLTKAEKLLTDKGVPKEKLILVFDNEPRSENIVKAMNIAIQKGFSIVILPETTDESCKDINDLIKTKNYSASEVLHLLESNTYSNDTTASRFITQLKFRNWKKVS